MEERDSKDGPTIKDGDDQWTIVNDSGYKSDNDGFLTAEDKEL